MASVNAQLIESHLDNTTLVIALENELKLVSEERDELVELYGQRSDEVNVLKKLYRDEVRGADQ